MSRELYHDMLLVNINYKFNGYDLCQKEVTVFLTEVEELVWEAEIKELLPLDPSDIHTDIRTVMDERHIPGKLRAYVEYDVVPVKTTIDHLTNA